MTNAHALSVTLQVDGGEIVVHLNKIAPSVFEYAVTTTAPGWGGLYGGKTPADERYANEYSATVAGMLAARRYWLVKRHHLLVRNIDAFVTAYCFDCAEVGKIKM